MPIPTPLRAPPIPNIDLLTLLLDKPGTDYPSTRILFHSDSDDSHLTFDTLKVKVKQFGEGLRKHALVKTDDNVMILALHGLHYPIAVFGIMAAGATCVPINPALLVSDIVKYVEATGSRVLIVGPEFGAAAEALQKLYTDLRVIEIAPRGKSKNLAWNDCFQCGEREWPRDQAARDRNAIIAFSSGTSGLPKGCVITQANIVANQWIAYHGTRKPGATTIHSVYVGAFPPFHAAGLWGSMVNPLFRGHTQILMSSFTFPKFLELIAKHKPTDLSVAPPIVLGLAVGPGIERVDFSSVKHIGTGAAPLSAELEQKCLQRLRKCGAKDVRMKQVWGMTELVCCASAFPEAGDAPYNQHEEDLMSGSVGFPLPHLSIKLVDPESMQEILTPGERGEILVRGPCVFKGYLPSTLPPDAQRSDYFTEDDYYRTGDIGVADADGRIRIVDRIKELIKVSANQVAPGELEGILLQSDLISDCAVIGVPPRPGASQELVKKGELVMAFIVPAAVTGKNAMHPERLRKVIHAWFNPQVVGFKRLTGGIRVVESVPKVCLLYNPTDVQSPSGKILRRLLRDQIDAEWKQSAVSKL